MYLTCMIWRASGVGDDSRLGWTFSSGTAIELDNDGTYFGGASSHMIFSRQFSFCDDDELAVS